jgi:hypothetical protein
MTKHLPRTCPRCSDFFGVIVGKTPAESAGAPVKGCCMHCGYQIEWKLINGSGRRQKRFGSYETEPIKDV